MNRYRFPGQSSQFQALGNPLMEIGDCISIDDEKKDTISAPNKVWIESINTEWGNKIALDKYETTNYAPWESQIPKMPVKLSNFGNKAIVNVIITNGGTEDSPYDPYS